MNFKRGQAAMEYLMTYGWAILVIVIVLAALLYLGIFNVKPPEVCTMPAGMTCSKFYLKNGTTTSADCSASTDSCANVTLVNGLQKTIVITAISITKKADQFDACTSASTTTRCPGALLISGSTYGVTVPLGSSMSSLSPVSDENGAGIIMTGGDDFSGKVNIMYYFKDEGAGALRKISGNTYARVT